MSATEAADLARTILAGSAGERPADLVYTLTAREARTLALAVIDQLDERGRTPDAMGPLPCGCEDPFNAVHLLDHRPTERRDRMTRPLILDLLPQTAWSSIARVTVDSGNMEFYACLVRGDDGKWRVKGRPHIIVDPADITEFTVHQGEDKTTWTEGSHANEWSCTIERRATT